MSSQTPRTPAVTAPRAEDDPSDADDGTVEDVAFADENDPLSLAIEPPPTDKKKRGRSPNWLACEIVGALLARQFAVRDCGPSSRKEVRQSSAARVYPGIIRALDRAGLCSWSLEGGKLPQSAEESVKARTDKTAEAAIYQKGDTLKQGLKTYCQQFGTLYPGFSKNSYAPSSGDNDGTVTWNATEVECAKRLKAAGTQLVAGIESCQLAFRIVCSSSPYLPEESVLRTYVDTAFALNPAERLDQETVPTEKEFRLYKKRQLKIAANDMVYGQIPNTDATERAASDRQELMRFVSELREMMRAEMARDEGGVLQTQDTISDTADYERDLREKLRAEIHEQMRAEMQEQIRANVHEQILALKQSFEAVPSPQPPVSTDVQTPPHANLPDSPPPALTSEPSRRSVRVKRVKQR
mmetsp:Transcript_2609/g.9465  ORF Transcript_2609/g.9465 Transcript_2609/m.9465 type:complete len:411 (+) Transcript_2609:62-1294(+)